MSIISSNLIELIGNIYDRFIFNNDRDRYVLYLTNHYLQTGKCTTSYVFPNTFMAFKSCLVCNCVTTTEVYHAHLINCLKSKVEESEKHLHALKTSILTLEDLDKLSYAFNVVPKNNVVPQKRGLDDDERPGPSKYLKS